MKKLLSEMSLNQKVGQLNQYLYGWDCYEIKAGKVVLSEILKKHILEYDGIGAIYGLFRADPWSNVDLNSGLSYSQSIQLINMIRTYILENCSKPIMPLIVEEMPHGHQGLNAKCYPVNLATAATFNHNLYGQSVREQLAYANSIGINVGLISGLDVARDTRWGRTEETFGADPFLSSRFTEQIAKHFKNDNTVACLKHFAAQGAPYMGLNSGAVNIGERELREIHLPPTVAAVEHGVELIMAAYNEIDGIPCHANEWLLNQLLRKELGFNGIIMADGQALNRLISENISTHQAAALALTAGIGLSLWDEVYLQLEEAVEAKYVAERLLNKRVLEILKLKNKLNLLSFSVLDENKLNQSDEVNYQLAQESIILQKNTNHYLPIGLEQNCLFIGDTYDNIYTFLGDYTAYQDPTKYLDLKRLITRTLKRAKCINVDQAFMLTKAEIAKYDKVFVIGGGSSARDFGMEFEDNGALKNGNETTDSGENVDVGSIKLSNKQYRICDKLNQLNVKYGFICIQGRPYALKQIAIDAQAILSVYYNGQQGPQAIVDTIIGVNNPSGKNPISMPFYPEYFGYEYNSKQDMRNSAYTQKQNLLFEFGHGLSYSRIVYKSCYIDANKLIVNVKNDSNLEGKEVIQIYIKKANSIVVKRRRELVDYKKVVIAPNSTIEVGFDINSNWFESLDINNKITTEKGNYKIIVGTGTKTYFEENILK